MLEGFASLTQLQTPFPAAVFQNEPQRVVYEDNTYLLSPYKVAKQVTKARHWRLTVLPDTPMQRRMELGNQS